MYNVRVTKGDFYMSWVYTQSLEETVLENIKKNGLKYIKCVYKTYSYISVDVSDILKNDNSVMKGEKVIMCVYLKEGHEFFNSASIWFEIGTDKEYPDTYRERTTKLSLSKGCGYGMAIVMRLADLCLSFLSEPFNKMKKFDFELYKTMRYDDALFRSFLFYRREVNEYANMYNEEDCRKHWNWEWDLNEKYYKNL